MTTCPKCGHTFGPNKNRRICDICKQPILKYHKYMFVKSKVRHRNCKNPTVYNLSSPYKK